MTHELLLVFVYLVKNDQFEKVSSNNDGHFGPYSSIPWTLSRSKDTYTYMPHLNQLFLWFNSFEVTFNLKSSEFRNILELGLNYNGSTQSKINFMVIIQGDNLYFSSEMKRILVRSAWVWVEGTYLNRYSKQLLVCYDSSSCI